MFKISSKILWNGNLANGTAYDILSVDIADVDLGRNVGAELLKNQAEADKQIAQAKAEERKAMALAAEQERKVELVEAQTEVPKAIAGAFKEGKLGVYDYYRLQNILADTDMRKAFSNSNDSKEG